MGINKAILLGNVGQDPALNATSQRANSCTSKAKSELENTKLME